MNLSLIRMAIIAAYSVVDSALPKTFSVILSNPTNGVLTSATALVTITNVGKINPVINATRLTGVAPFGIVFDAQQTLVDPALTSVPFHECHFAWHFGDSVADTQTWPYGTKAGSASKNTAYGPVATHVFEQSGTFTVTLTVTHISSLGIITASSKTATVVIANSDTIWSANSIYVSSSGVPVPGVGGVPAGANVQQITTWSQIGTLANTYKRIFLKRGDTWSTDGAAIISATGPGYIGAYGTGNLPEIIMVANSAAFSLNTSDWRFEDLNIHGNGTDGTQRDPFAVFGSFFLFNRLTIGYGRVLLNLATSSDYVISNCDLHHNQNYSVSAGYCIYADASNRLGIIGNHMHDNLGSHLCRLQGAAFAAVTHNTFDKIDGGGLCLTVRGFQNSSSPATWVGVWSEYVVASDNVCKMFTGIGTTNTGSYVVYFGPQAVGHAERVKDIIFERNYVWGSRLSGIEANVADRFTCRNNIIVAFGPSAIVFAGGGNAAGAPPAANNKFYNNTIYKASNVATGAFSPIYVGDSGISNSGNIFYNNLAYVVGATSDGATNGTKGTFYIDGGTTGGVGTNVLFSNNTSNAQINDVNPFMSPSVTPVVSFSGFSPLLYALNSGLYAPTNLDFLGSPISGQYDMGAIWA